MRTQITLLALALAGFLGGGALIGLWVLGMCLIFASVAIAWYAVWGHDDGKPAPQVHQIPGHAVKTLDQVLGRSRAS